MSSGFDKFFGGVLFDPPVDPAFPPVSFAYADVNTIGIPRKMFPLLGGPQFQKRAGSCLPHGYAACVESWAANQPEPIDLQISIMDWYFGARWLAGDAGRDVGSYPTRGRQWSDQYGLLTAARAPYDDGAVNTWRPKSEWAADRLMLRSVFEPVPLMSDAFLAELAKLGTLPVCHKVVGSINSVSRTTGYETFVDDGKNYGGHCRLLCGYDLDLQIPGYQAGAGLLFNWWENFGIAHPMASSDSRFAEYHTSFSWVPLQTLENKSFFQDAARLAVPPKVAA